MEITFREDSTLGEGTFVRVLRGGCPFGKVFHRAGIYRFYTGDHEKLGGADLSNEDLDRLKVEIKSKYA